MRQYGKSSAHFHTSHTVQLNRTDVHNTHTRPQCIVTQTATRPYTPSSMAPIKWNRQRRRPNKQLFVPFCCSTRKMLFFFQSRKSSSFFLVVGSVCVFAFRSVSECFFFSTCKWHRITFTVFFHFYYYCQH